MRTTIKTLESLVQLINKMTDSAPTMYTKTGHDRMPNVGHYHLEEPVGGFRLCRMMNSFGGTNDIFYGNTKRELEDKLRAFISGYALARVKENDVRDLIRGIHKSDAYQNTPWLGENFGIDGEC